MLDGGGEQGTDGAAPLHNNTLTASDKLGTLLHGVCKPHPVPDRSRQLRLNVHHQHGQSETRPKPGRTGQRPEQSLKSSLIMLRVNHGAETDRGELMMMFTHLAGACS